MRLKYLGTAAYEGFPGLFCECEVCQRATQRGGKNIRTRTSMLINDDTLVDFPPDMYMHKLRYNLNLANMRYYLITHSHSDHFAPFDLMARAEGGYAYFEGKNKNSTIQVCGNTAVKRFLDLAVDVEFGGNQNFINYIDVTPFKTYAIGKLNVTPLLAQHQVDEESLIYLVEQDGKTLLYGNDTGIFPEETFEYLKKVKIDLVSLDCTHGARYPGGVGHMGLESNIKTKERLTTLGCVHANTKFVITHFSHNCGMLHGELEEVAQPHGFEVAYDGLEIVL